MMEALKQPSLSKIILEDIANLAEALSDSKKYFEGKTFLITGAGGFLGRYISLFLKYLNESVLENKLTAFLLDNFVTRHEQKIMTTDQIIFQKHNVIDPFNID